MNQSRFAPLALAGLALLGLAPMSVAQTAQLTVRGNLQYVHGINAAWFFGRYGTDIGLNPRFPEWGNGYNASVANNVFADIKRMNCNVVRIWLHEDLEGLQFDSNGYVSGLQPGFLTNLDDLVTKANNNGLALELTFLNHTLNNQFGQTLPSGATIKNFINDSTARQRLIDNAIRPIAQRYYNNAVLRPAIFGYDLINEANIGADNGSYTWANMRTFASEAATAIHGVNASIKVTMSTQWWAFDNQSYHSGRFGGLGLDYYTYHEYSNSPNLPTKPNWLEKPLVLAEYGPSTWTDSQQNSSTSAYLSQAASRGYAGAMAWMYWHSSGNGENVATSEGGNQNWEPTGFTLQSYGAQLFGGGGSTQTWYNDALASDWQDWSWGCTNNANNTSPVQTGTRSYAVTYTQGWAGFSLRKGTAQSTSGFSRIRFWVNGGSSTKSLTVYTSSADGSGNSSSVTVSAPANTWTEVTVTLSQLGNPSAIKRLYIQNNSASSQSVMYLDNIRLTN
ncbi:MAG: hypothetical protein SFX74_00350 [Fimbriimonadaceae bacterium]|nr:hypothetical protein [Fimbriimonadaceae bacterium]